jgi:hypothetical protein
LGQPASATTRTMRCMSTTDSTVRGWRTSRFGDQRAPRYGVLPGYPTRSQGNPAIAPHRRPGWAFVDRSTEAQPDAVRLGRHSGTSTLQLNVRFFGRMDALGRMVNDGGRR